MGTNPPRNGQFDISRHFRNARRPVAPRIALIYRTRRGHGRPATRGMAISSSALADALEGKEPIPGVKGREGGGQHEDFFSVTVPSMATVPPTDELILANRANSAMGFLQQEALQRLNHVYQRRSRQLLRPLCREARLQQPDGQVAWRAMGGKYLNSSKQWWRILMRKLNGMAMRLNQDPDEYLTGVFQQRS